MGIKKRKPMNKERLYLHFLVKRHFSFKKKIVLIKRLCCVNKMDFTKSLLISLEI